MPGRWIKQQNSGVAQVFRGNGKLIIEGAEIRRLAEENQRLKMEKDILKKAMAFFGVSIQVKLMDSVSLPAFLARHVLQAMVVPFYRLVRYSRPVYLPGYRLRLVFSHFVAPDSCKSRNPDALPPPFLRKIHPLT